MTAVQEGELTRQRPVTVVVAAVLTVLVAAFPAAQLVFSISAGGSAEMLTPYLVGAVATAACWLVTVPGLLGGRTWAQVAVSALSAVSVAQGLPLVIGVVGHLPDGTLLAFAGAALAPLVVLALVWNAPARAWFGPLR